jgi:hypothetical protein
MIWSRVITRPLIDRPPTTHENSDAMKIRSDLDHLLLTGPFEMPMVVDERQELLSNMLAMLDQ